MTEIFNKIEESLIPYRHLTRGNNFPQKLVNEIFQENTNFSKENFVYFTLFADLLLFYSSSGTDRNGANLAFEGLEEVLNSCFESINISYGKKEQILFKLHTFQKKLFDFDSRNSVIEANRPPEKKENLITRFLVDERKNYHFNPDFHKFVENLRVERIQKKALKKISRIIKAQKGLNYSEILAIQILTKIDLFLEKQRLEIAEIEELESLISLLEEKLNNRWQKICLIGYCAIRRAIESPAPTEDKHLSRSNSSSWAISTILRYVPQYVLENSDYFADLGRGAISDSLRICYNSSHYVSESVDQIGRISWFLPCGKNYRWGTKWRVKKDSKNEKNVIFQNRKNSSEFEELDKQPISEQIPQKDFWKEEIDLQIAEGADEEEFILAENSPIEETSPVGSSSESRAFRLTLYQPTWEKNHLTEEVLGVTWAWLKEKSETNASDIHFRTLLLFFELQIYFGFSAKSLVKAKFCKTDKNFLLDCNLVITRNSILIKPVRENGERPFAAPLLEKTDIYEPSNSTFEVLTPINIGKYINLLFQLKGDEFFFYQLFNQKDSVSALKQINILFKPLNDLINERITLNKVSKSIKSLLYEAKILTDLEINFLSGEIPRHCASPMFYTNFEVEPLFQRKEVAINEVIKSIIKNSSSFIKQLNLPKLEIDLNELPGIIENESFPSQRIGSPFVPKPIKFGSYLRGLAEETTKTKKLILKHNRRTALSALLLMLQTGIRPLELFSISNHLINVTERQSKLTIIAKINQKHSEWRVLEISDFAIRILRRYQQFREQTLSNLEFNTRISRGKVNNLLGERLFFFLRNTFTPVSLSTRGLGQLLREESFLEFSPFDWKLNAPRHLYRTTSQKIGVPEKVINALLGHQTVGYEALGLYSAQDRTEQRKYAEIISKEINHQLSITWEALNFNEI